MILLMKLLVIVLIVLLPVLCQCCGNKHLHTTSDTTNYNYYFICYTNDTTSDTSYTTSDIISCTHVPTCYSISDTASYTNDATSDITYTSSDTTNDTTSDTTSESNVLAVLVPVLHQCSGNKHLYLCLYDKFISYET